MRRLLKILFVVMLLAWGALGLRHAQGRRGEDFARQGAAPAATLEIFETGDEAAPAPARIEWVARRTVAWVNDSEVEE